MQAKILIVDDYPENIHVIVSIFEKYNPEFELFIAPNGETALNIAKKIIPDIIITDWDMPRMNGIELIKKIRHEKFLYNIPVIMATGIMKSVENLKIALEAGANDFITKPINEIELVARTNSAINLSIKNKEIIDKKNHELVENTLLLIRNNEFNKTITQKLQTLLLLVNKKNLEAKYIIDNIINNVENKIKTDNWTKFEISFNAVHENFYKNLLSDFPNLSSTELKICAFIKLNMSSKDIAAVQFITPESVKVARSRLRKKLNLTIKDNLITFLSKY